MGQRICVACDEETTPNTEYCKTCGSGRRYAKKKGPAWRLKRRRKLRIYENRLETFHDNVVELPKLKPVQHPTPKRVQHPTHKRAARAEARHA